MTTLGLELTPQLGMAFHPSVDTVLTAELVALPDAALGERLMSEAGRNPALIVERAARPGVEPRVTRPRAFDASPAQDWGAPEHPATMLVADAAPSLRPEDRAIALELAFALDRRGFLPAPCDQLARSLAVSPARLGRIVGTLQKAGPVGVATEGPSACVIAQLRALRPRPPWVMLAIRLVEDHLEDLARGRLEPVARRLGLCRAAVEQAVDGMRRCTRPYPDWDPPGNESPPARADVITEQVGERIDVRLADEERYEVWVDERMVGADRGLAHEARAAEAWRSRVQRRREAVLAVARETVRRQEPALRDGLSQLRPLTRREVAFATGLPESTVSRVVAQRTLATPSGRLLPFAALFGTALDALAVLRQLIDDAPAPLSDRALAEAMTRRGYPIARRTVAKYRGRLGIAPLLDRS